MKLLVLSCTLAAVIRSGTAFVPYSTRGCVDSHSGLLLFSTTDGQQQQKQQQQVVESSSSTDLINGEQQWAEEAESPPAAINGWIPDSSKPCFGLPGVVAPTGYFDPLGFSQDGITLNEVKRYREAEIMHGRVAMLAFLGYFVGESFPGPFGLSGPANDQLSQLPVPILLLFGAGIGYLEINRAKIGWVEPNLSSWTTTLWTLRDNYYPGDVGFDPLNLKPTDPTAYRNMQTRELQNGRLAMIAVAGMCSQELVNHRTILGTIDFYNMVYNGINPYESCGDGLIC